MDHTPTVRTRPSPRAPTASSPASPLPKAELWTSGVQFDFYDRDSNVTPAVDAIVDHLDRALGRA